MPENEVPRIVINNCVYVGELDFFSLPSLFWLLMDLRSDGIVTNAKKKWHVDFPCNEKEIVISSGIKCLYRVFVQVCMASTGF